MKFNRSKQKTGSFDVFKDLESLAPAGAEKKTERPNVVEPHLIVDGEERCYSTDPDLGKIGLGARLAESVGNHWLQNASPDELSNQDAHDLIGSQRAFSPAAGKSITSIDSDSSALRAERTLADYLKIPVRVAGQLGSTSSEQLTLAHLWFNPHHPLLQADGKTFAPGSSVDESGRLIGIRPDRYVSSMHNDAIDLYKNAIESGNIDPRALSKGLEDIYGMHEPHVSDHIKQWIRNITDPRSGVQVDTESSMYHPLHEHMWRDLQSFEPAIDLSPIRVSHHLGSGIHCVRDISPAVDFLKSGPAAKNSFARERLFKTDQSGQFDYTGLPMNARLTTGALTWRDGTALGILHRAKKHLDAYKTGAHTGTHFQLPETFLDPETQSAIDRIRSGNTSTLNADVLATLNEFGI